MNGVKFIVYFYEIVFYYRLMFLFTLRQLEYLATCVDCGSIAKAAEKLNVSQPTISVAIQKLEDQFGLQLLLRHHSHGVTATAGADHILPAARKLLADAAGLQRQAMSTSTAIVGDLRLVSFSTLAPIFLPALVQAFSQNYPNVRIRIWEGTQSYLLRQLYAGQIDLALLYDVALAENLRRVALAAGAAYVLLPAGHPLSKQTAVSLAELVDEPMILLNVPPSRQFFLGLFDAAGLTPQIAFTSPSLELVRGMVGQGLGYSILVTRPQGDLTYDGKHLEVRPLSDANTDSSIVLVSRADLQQTRLVAGFESLALSLTSAGKILI